MIISNYNQRINELLSIIQMQGLPIAFEEIQAQLNEEVRNVEISDQWMDFLAGNLNDSLTRRVLSGLRERLTERESVRGPYDISMDPNEPVTIPISRDTQLIPNSARPTVIAGAGGSGPPRNLGGQQSGVIPSGPIPVMIVAPVPLPVSLLGPSGIRGGAGGASPPDQNQQSRTDEDREQRQEQRQRNAAQLDLLSGLAGLDIKMALGAVGRGALGSTLGPIGIAAVALWTLTEAAFAAGENLKASNFKLAEWSASMTKVQVDSVMRNIYFDQIRGEKLSASAAGFTKAWDEFLFRFNTTVSDPFRQKMNVFGQALSEAGSDIISGSWWKAALGASVGGLAGFFIGGPVGAAAGSILGASKMTEGEAKKLQEMGAGENLGQWMTNLGREWYEEFRKPRGAGP